MRFVLSLLCLALFLAFAVPASATPILVRQRVVVPFAPIVQVHAQPVFAQPVYAQPIVQQFVQPAYVQQVQAFHAVQVQQVHHAALAVQAFAVPQFGVHSAVGTAFVQNRQFFRGGPTVIRSRTVIR